MILDQWRNFEGCLDPHYLLWYGWSWELVIQIGVAIVVIQGMLMGIGDVDAVTAMEGREMRVRDRDGRWGI